MKFEELQNDMVSIKTVRNNICFAVYAILAFYFLRTLVDIKNTKAAPITDFKTFKFWLNIKAKLNVRGPSRQDYFKIIMISSRRVHSLHR